MRRVWDDHNCIAHVALYEVQYICTRLVDSGGDVHHCGIAQGHGEVAYASKDGGKINTIDDATRQLGNVRPIIRRFK